MGAHWRDLVADLKFFSPNVLKNRTSHPEPHKEPGIMTIDGQDVGGAPHSNYKLAQHVLNTSEASYQLARTMCAAHVAGEDRFTLPSGLILNLVETPTQYGQALKAAQDEYDRIRRLREEWKREKEVVKVSEQQFQKRTAELEGQVKEAQVRLERAKATHAKKLANFKGKYDVAVAVNSQTHTISFVGDGLELVEGSQAGEDEAVPPGSQARLRGELTIVRGPNRTTEPEHWGPNAPVVVVDRTLRDLVEPDGAILGEHAAASQDEREEAVEAIRNLPVVQSLLAPSPPSVTEPLWAWLHAVFDPRFLHAALAGLVSIPEPPTVPPPRRTRVVELEVEPDATLEENVGEDEAPRPPAPRLTGRGTKRKRSVKRRSASAASAPGERTPPAPTPLPPSSPLSPLPPSRDISRSPSGVPASDEGAAFEDDGPTDRAPSAGPYRDVGRTSALRPVRPPPPSQFASPPQGSAETPLEEDEEEEYVQASGRVQAQRDKEDEEPLNEGSERFQTPRRAQQSHQSRRPISRSALALPYTPVDPGYWDDDDGHYDDDDDNERDGSPSAKRSHPNRVPKVLVPSSSPLTPVDSVRTAPRYVTPTRQTPKISVPSSCKEERTLHFPSLPVGYRRPFVSSSASTEPAVEMGNRRGATTTRGLQSRRVTPRSLARLRSNPVGLNQ